MHDPEWLFNLRWYKNYVWQGKAYKETNQACCLFLKVLINLRNPNYENGDSLSFRTHLGLIQVPLKVKDIPELVSIHIED
jgi:hypothetical protein